MGLLSVEEAQSRLISAITQPVGVEAISLAAAHGRILAADLAALRTQPPFPASAMDGYAVRAVDLSPGARLLVIGASAAGHRFAGSVNAGEAVRIFTGAPVPDGADTILIQENAEGVGSPIITALQAEPVGRFARPAGLDFREGEILLKAGQSLDAARLSLAASMGHAMLSVRRKPRIAILATGDELVEAGELRGPDQIISSNSHGLKALIVEAGGEAIDLGIAADNMDALDAAFERAGILKADAIVTLGGASVGDHDLVQHALARRGLALDFWKIAMRPGKPLMFGQMGAQLVIGLPGNPVSSLVCGIVFVQPMVRALAGASGSLLPATTLVRLGRDLPANDERAEYMRVTLSDEAGDLPIATPFAKQDSSMLSRLASADALLIRPRHTGPAKQGDMATAILLRPRA
ncbi:MAG: molybdopterin molybdotransferase MoeA [Bosea sp. (in: a-proteobacteria)]